MQARTAVAVLGTLALAGALSAGELRGGGGAFVGSPRGDLGREIGTGGGLYGHGVYSGKDGILGLRLDASGFLYGSQTVRVPVASNLPRISRELVTDNTIADLMVGPQLTAPRGRIRPYVHAFVGVSYFSTTTDLVEPFPIGSVLTATNFDDTVFAYGGGGGVLIPFGATRSSAVDAGVRWIHGSRARYLAKGDLKDDGRGGVSFTPRSSDSDRLEFRIGVSFKL
jgi:hypothetical protein